MNTRLSSLLIIVISLMILLPGAVNTAWPAAGAPACELPEQQEQPQIISDGAGGIIVAWADERNGSEFELYVQRLDGSGDAYWTFNGIRVRSSFYTDIELAEMVPDGEHGAIIAARRRAR